MMAPKKYKTVTIANKAKAIQMVETGEKIKTDIAKEFDVPLSTLSTWLKHKDSILANVPKFSEARKRAREPKCLAVDKAVTMWFTSCRDNDIPLDGPMIRAKAEQFAVSLGVENFKASQGWFMKWKERNDVVFKNIHGESGSVDMKSAATWMSSVEDIIKNYEPRNVFNADESGLFYQCLPSSTFAFKGDRCFGGKNSKQRLSILVGANMDGSEKLPLLMIGKSKQPACFRNVKSKPVEYTNNKKAWMTSAVFQEWLLKLDLHFGKQKRKVLLFVDNCSAHKTVLNLLNIKVIFFPPNMTSIVQPMDQGIIKNLKHFYRKQIVLKMLSDIETNTLTKIDVLIASRMLKFAWEQVGRETIINCFAKAGFNSTVEPEVTVIIDENVNEWSAVSHGISFTDYVNVDDGVVVFGAPTDEEIITEVQHKKFCPDPSSDDDESDIETEAPAVVSSSEAQACVGKLFTYLEASENVPESLSAVLSRVESFILSQRVKAKHQQKITNYVEKM